MFCIIWDSIPRIKTSFMKRWNSSVGRITVGGGGGGGGGGECWNFVF